MSTQYQVNWNYKPATEKLIITKVSPAALKYPIVNFFEASVNNKSSITDCLSGSYYVNTSNNFTTGNWETQLKSVKANGTEVALSGNLSGTYGIKKSGTSAYFWSSWQQDYAPAADGDGYLRDIQYDIAMPQDIKIYTPLPSIYRTIFPSVTDTKIECTNILHSPVETAWSSANCTIEFANWSSNHVSEYPEDTFDSTIQSNWLVRSDNSESITASDLNQYGIARFEGYNTVYYNNNGTASSGSSIRSEYNGYSYDPSVKKVIYYNPDADQNLEQTDISYGGTYPQYCQITLDGHTYQYTGNGVHPDYLSPSDSTQYIETAYPIPLVIGLDHYRKTSITVKYADVTTIYNGNTTTTQARDIATEVFSDNGIFYIDGIQLVVNKWQNINQPSDVGDIAYNPILIKFDNDVAKGTLATLLEVAYY
jgi:hypothetical protein